MGGITEEKPYTLLTPTCMLINLRLCACDIPPIMNIFSKVMYSHVEPFQAPYTQSILSFLSTLLYYRSYTCTCICNSSLTTHVKPYNVPLKIYANEKDIGMKARLRHSVASPLSGGTPAKDHIQIQHMYNVLLSQACIIVYNIHNVNTSRT